MDSIAVIVPTYGALDYAVAAVRSVVSCTFKLRPIPIIIDDASPGMVPYDPSTWHRIIGRHDEIGETPDLHYLRQAATVSKPLLLLPKKVNGGLTAAWNSGLRIAKYLNADYALCTNSDVLFTEGWERAMCAALDRGYDLIGPLTNAPGTEKDQDIAQYLLGYQVTDDVDYLNELAARLYVEYESRAETGRINGFCMLAKTEAWWRNAYDASNVFKPRNDFDSKGHRNPTPLMTLNEYEYQGRLKEAGGVAGYALGSFVFHYRSVSRGARYKKGQGSRRRVDS